MMVEWFHRLDLPVGKFLVPVAWNWSFESGFGQAWLGTQWWREIFHSHARDGMLFAISLNDRAAFAGQPCPFSLVGLKSVSKHYDIINENSHDALSDSLVCAETYRAMLQHELF